MKFTLSESKWYVMECVFPTAERHHSPVWIRKVTPLGAGDGLLQVSFFHANQPPTERDKVSVFKVLHRDRCYLLALRVDEKLAPEATVILEDATLEWLQHALPDVAGMVTDAEPLDSVLDQLTERPRDDRS